MRPNDKTYRHQQDNKGLQQHLCTYTLYNTDKQTHFKNIYCAYKCVCVCTPWLVCILQTEENLKISSPAEKTMQTLALNSCHHICWHLPLMSKPSCWHLDRFLQETNSFICLFVLPQTESHAANSGSKLATKLRMAPSICSLPPDVRVHMYFPMPSSKNYQG